MIFGGELATTAVDHQFLGMLGDLGIEVIHQHPHRTFGGPGAAGLLGASWGGDDTFFSSGVHGVIIVLEQSIERRSGPLFRNLNESEVDAG